MVFGDSRITDACIQMKSFQLMPGLILRNRLELTPLFSLDFGVPRPWNEVNAPTTQSILVGVVKDLGLGWSETDSALWWPEEVECRHPKRSVDVPKGKKGGNNVYMQFTYPVCIWHNIIII